MDIGGGGEKGGADAERAREAASFSTIANGIIANGTQVADANNTETITPSNRNAALNRPQKASAAGTELATTTLTAIANPTTPATSIMEGGVGFGTTLATTTTALPTTLT